MTILDFVRHPQCLLNARKMMQGRGSDSPFSKLGDRQAAGLIEHLRCEGAKYDQVRIGTNGRHLRLGQRIERELGLPFTVDAGLCEADFGDWECCTKMEIQQWAPKLWAASRSLEDLDFRFPNGSSLGELIGQAGAYLDGYDYTVGRTLHITSGYFIRALCKTLGIEVPASVTPCAIMSFEGTSRADLRYTMLMQTDRFQRENGGG